MVSPVFFVDKKDSKLRFMQDYQKLNVMMVKNTYPLPLVPDIVNKISEAKAKTSQSWTYAGDITMYVLKRVTSGKLPAR